MDGIPVPASLYPWSFHRVPWSCLGCLLSPRGANRFEDAAKSLLIAWKSSIDLIHQSTSTIPSSAKTYADEDLFVGAETEGYVDYSEAAFAREQEHADAQETRPEARRWLTRTDSEITLVPTEPDPEKTPTIWDLLSNRDIVAILMYNLEMCFTSETFFSIYPVFAYTAVQNGEASFLFDKELRQMLMFGCYFYLCRRFGP